jgi:serine phosphatase RsbU (regulator of sigma subunit)
VRTLRWSSAGHLPPLLVHRDGAVETLTTPPERLLGADSEGQRSDHEAVVVPGDTVVLYTDGLVETGRSGLDEGIARLAAELGRLHELPLADLCDQVLAALVPERTDDDIAVLAIRSHAQDGVG